MCFSLYLGISSEGRGGSQGIVHNLQFFTLGTSKLEVLETYFSDTVIT